MDMVDLVERIATDRSYQAKWDDLRARVQRGEIDEAEALGFVAQVAMQLFDAAMTAWTEPGKRTKLGQALMGLRVLWEKAQVAGSAGEPAARAQARWCAILHSYIESVMRHS